MSSLYHDLKIITTTSSSHDLIHDLTVHSHKNKDIQHNIIIITSSRPSDHHHHQQQQHHHHHHHHNHNIQNLLNIKSLGRCLKKNTNIIHIYKVVLRSKIDDIFVPSLKLT